MHRQDPPPIVKKSDLLHNTGDPIDWDLHDRLVALLFENRELSETLISDHPELD